ncbi:hypothetical protein [Larkinella humicola]|uniref:Uncharacterized protein n=1 Tax=Larkinella humicola TaxID=2607654 RepID=A0A5N1JD99_9BACT|nr:hypothetical protein [Larkinella humicola]KAA9349743.1 hypothetical protein F0P93_20030 [Larkinella humicola]
MATEKANESLVEMKLTKAATEKRIFDLNQLIKDLGNQREVIWNSLMQNMITGGEHNVYYVEIEQQWQQHLADMDQQKQKLRSIRWALSFTDRSRL